MNIPTIEELGLVILSVGTNHFVADRMLLSDLAVALSAFHGRVCAEINDCRDMNKATALGNTLHEILMASAHVNKKAEKAGDLNES